MPTDPSVFAFGTDQSKGSKIRKWSFPILVLLILIAITVVAGTFSYILTDQLETRRFEKDYNSLANNAVILLQKSLFNSATGARTMSLILSNAFPYARLWPQAYLLGYGRITSSLTTGVITHAPIVLPDQVDSFERFAYESFNRTFRKPVAQSSFGEGIYAVRNTSSFDTGRYHDVTGDTTYGSEYKVLVPVLQGNISRLMYNIHSEEVRGTYIDKVIRCASARNKRSVAACGVLSEPTVSLITKQVASIMFDAVYPAYNTSTLVGVTIGSIFWDEMINELFPLFVTGIRCVLRAGDVVYTFVIVNGRVTEISTGDHHDSKYNSYAVSTDIDLGSELSSVSSTYAMTFYPSDRFARKYRKGGPLFITCIVVFVLVLLIVLGSCGIYFAWTRRKASENAALGKAKKLFVRYISHEIRTPLNTLSLGLDLLLSELSLTISPTHNNRLTPRNSNSKTAQIAFRGKCTEWRKLVAELIENSQCAVLLLDDLLSFEQLEEAAQDQDGGGEMLQAGVEMQVFPVWELLQKTVLSFSVRTRLGDVKLEVKFENAAADLSQERRGKIDRLRVVGKEGQLKRVVSTLLSNALQYSREGGTVNVSAMWIDFTASVRDNEQATTPTSPPAATDNSKCCPIVKMCPKSLSSAESGEASDENNRAAQRANSWQQDERLGMTRAGVVRLAVKDEGAGMTPEQIAQVFGHRKRFSISALQAGQGSGIGLFVCKIIAEQHRASISVASEGPGHGSTYILDLPVYLAAESAMDNRSLMAESGSMRAVSVSFQDHYAVPTINLRSASPAPPIPPAESKDETSGIEMSGSFIAPAPAPAPAPEAEQSVGDNADLRRSVSSAPSLRALDLSVESGFVNKRILVVDDAPSNRKMLSRVLSKYGHTCDQAQDGQVSLDMFLACSTTEPYDMILMDYEMPVMNGPTATKQLRELGCTVPIVGVTGNVLAADVEYFMNQGADAVLPKPLQMPALEEVWDRYVSMRASASQDHYG